MTTQTDKRIYDGGRELAAHPPIFCKRCEARLIRQAKSKLCGFCLVETGKRKPI